jgi:catalase
MATVKGDRMTELSRDVIQAFDNLNGLHPGFRPAHAKGILLSGVFQPSAGGSALTKAPHLQRQSTPVTVRFSDFAGIPTIPDNDPNASPNGIGIRFHLAEHVHTDITAHAVDGFPTRTVEEFLEFLRAAYASGPAASGPTASKPAPIELFLGSHPAALRFVQTPKPFAVSFAKESFYAVNAYKFTNQAGSSRYGRYRIHPDGGAESLSPEAAAARTANYLFDEIKERIAKGPVKLRVSVQLAAEGDIVDDSTVHWPEDRPQVEFGTIQLSGVVPDNEAEQRHIIFDPIPRVEGIEPSGDPLLEPRAAVYLMSGRRRRANGPK